MDVSDGEDFIHLPHPLPSQGQALSFPHRVGRE